MSKEIQNALAAIDKRLARLSTDLHDGGRRSSAHIRKIKADIDVLLDKRNAVAKGELKTAAIRSTSDIPALSGGGTSDR